MNNFEKIIKFLSQQKVKIPLLMLAALLLLMGLFRSCSEADSIEKYSFVVARDVSWYPFNTFNRDQNMVGFTSDLFAEIEANQNVAITLFDVPSKNLIYGLDRGNWDGVLSSMRPDPLTLQKYDFSDPFYISGLVLLVPNDSQIKNLEDTNGKIIGVLNTFTPSSSLAQEAAFYTSYDSIPALMDALVSGRIDGVILDFLYAQRYLQSGYTKNIKIITTPVVDNGLRLVTLKKTSNKVLIDEFNKGLKQLQSNGTYEKLLNKWSLLYQ